MREGVILAEALDCNFGALRMASRRVTALYDRHLAAAGVTSGQFSILVEIARLSRKSPPTLTELADALAMDRSGLTHTLRPLERDGLVQIGPDRGERGDRRVRLIRLTPAGRARLEKAHARWRAAQGQFESAFGARQAVALRALLRLVADAELENG